jgi:hypothetical protein
MFIDGVNLLAIRESPARGNEQTLVRALYDSGRSVFLVRLIARSDYCSQAGRHPAEANGKQPFCCRPSVAYVLQRKCLRCSTLLAGDSISQHRWSSHVSFSVGQPRAGGRFRLREGLVENSRGDVKAAALFGRAETLFWDPFRSRDKVPLAVEEVF